MPVNSYGFYWDYLRETRPKPPLDPRGAGIADFWRISAVFGPETGGEDPTEHRAPSTEHRAPIRRAAAGGGGVRRRRPAAGGQRPSNSGHRTAAIDHRTAASDQRIGGRADHGPRTTDHGPLRYASPPMGQAAGAMIHYLERMQEKKSPAHWRGSPVDCAGGYNVRNTPSGSRNFISVQPAFGVPKSSSGSNPSKSPQIFPA